MTAKKDTAATKGTKDDAAKPAARDSDGKTAGNGGVPTESMLNAMRNASTAEPQDADPKD